MSMTPEIATVDTDKVTTALREAAESDLAAEQQTQTPPPVPEAEVPASQDDETASNPPADAASEQQAAVDSFMNIDPATLPPELQAMYKNMQGHFTKTMQEVAPFRTLADQYGVTADEMQQAVEFVGRLQSDPAYTQQVYSALGEHLQTLGFREPQAVPASPDNGAADFGGFDPGEDTSPVDNTQAPAGQQSALEQRLAQMEQVVMQQQQTAYMRELAAQIKEQELAIRQSHPEWKDGDIQRIYELAPSYEGDLTKASEAYNGWRTEVLQDYLQTKAQAPLGTPAGASTGTEVPQPAANLREATLRAEEALRASFDG